MNGETLVKFATVLKEAYADDNEPITDDELASQVMMLQTIHNRFEPSVKDYLNEASLGPAGPGVKALHYGKNLATLAGAGLLVSSPFVNHKIRNAATGAGLIAARSYLTENYPLYKDNQAMDARAYWSRFDDAQKQQDALYIKAMNNPAIAAHTLQNLDDMDAVQSILDKYKYPKNIERRVRDSFSKQR